MAAVLLPFVKAAWGFLKITIPVPLAALVAAFLWVQFDKGSSVRKAVDKAVRQLVAGAELDAARAALAAQRELSAAWARQAHAAAASARADALAREAFEQLLAASEAENKDIQNEIDDLLAAPAPAACAVDDRVFERLRNR